MKKIYAIISYLVCFLPTGTCHSYQLIGTATLSEELVAQHYTINPKLDAVIVVDRTTPTFEYQTYYGAGSVDEAQGQQGRIHFLEAVLKTRTAFEKLSNQPPDASQNAPYHRYIHPICLIFYFCFFSPNSFKTASKKLF